MLAHLDGVHGQAVFVPEDDRVAADIVADEEPEQGKEACRERPVEPASAGGRGQVCVWHPSRPSTEASTVGYGKCSPSPSRASIAAGGSVLVERPGGGLERSCAPATRLNPALPF